MTEASPKGRNPASSGTSVLGTDKAARKAWMSVVAKAESEELLALWAAYGAHPAFEWLRSPEVGAVMVRGRMGGSGAPFNLGEMTVTRCALALVDGPVGHGYVQGRSKPHAEAAALIDALMQTDAAAEVRARVLTPLQDRHDACKSARAARAAATKVEFFTMVRGEDA